MSNNIISRLNTHLQSTPSEYGPGITRNPGESIEYKNNGERPSTMTRYMGGAHRVNQPFISGYHHVWFKLPSSLYRDGIEEHAAKWLRSTCEGFTPHSSSLNMVDVNGIGQVGASFASSKTVNREFTLTFREYQNLPILNILRLWHSIFDPHLGVSPLGPAGFIPINYKGWVIVAVMKPTFDVETGNLSVEDLEEGYIYDGVVPLTEPSDTATASDQASNDVVQESVTFRFDGHPLTLSYPGVGEKIVDLFSEDSYYQNYDKLNVLIRNFEVS